MKRLTVLLIMAAILLSGASAGDYLPDCPPVDNHGRLLFAAEARASGALVCRYTSAPETPPCPFVTARGGYNMKTSIKPNGVVVCVYEGAN